MNSYKKVETDFHFTFRSPTLQGIIMAYFSYFLLWISNHFSESLYLELFEIILYFWMYILFSFPLNGKCNKFYLKVDLIIFPLRFDIGVPYKSMWYE